MFPESWEPSGCSEVRSLQWTAIDPWLEGDTCYFVEPLLQTGSVHRLHDFSQWIFLGNCGIRNRPPVCHTGTVSSFNPLRRRYSTVLQRSSGKAGGVPEHLWCDLLVVSLDLSVVLLLFWVSFCPLQQSSHPLEQFNQGSYGTFHWRLMASKGGYFTEMWNEYPKMEYYAS